MRRTARLVGTIGEADPSGDGADPLAGETAPAVALQGVRLLCALAVMTNHWGDASYDRLLPQAQVAIDFLFAAEGWLAADLLSRRPDDARVRPVLVRLGEIYPLYAAGLLLGLVACLAQMRQGLLAVPPSLPWHAFLSGLVFQPVRVGWPTPNALFPLNWPSWAIVFEMWAYVLLCLCRRHATARLLSGIAAVGAVGVIVAAIRYQDINVGWRVEHAGFGVFRVLFAFFSGAALYRLGPLGRRWLPALHPVMVWLAIAVILMMRMRHVALPFLLLLVPSITLLAGLARKPRWLNGAGCYAQRYALGIYLLHFPVLVLLRVAAAALSLPSEWVASFWSYLFALGAVLAAGMAGTWLVADRPISSPAPPARGLANAGGKRVRRSAPQP